MFAALNNNLRFTISIALFIIASLIGTACCADSLKEKAWYKYAEEYIKLDQTMNMNIVERKESFVHDYGLLTATKAKILNSSSPTTDELLILLTSNDILEQRIALVNMMVRPVYDERLVERAIKLNDPFDNYFRKLYSYVYFMRLDKNEIKAHEGELVKLIEWETNGALVITVMPILTQLEPSKVLPLFKDFLKREDRGIRTAAFFNLRNWGENYMGEVKRQLEMENAVEALKFINNLEAELEAQPK